MQSFFLKSYLLVLLVSTAVSGTEWCVPIRFRPTSLDSDYTYIYYFGERSGATDGYDAFIDLALPVLPPDGFTPYFTIEDTFMSFLREDYRTISTPGEGHVNYIWQLSFQGEDDESTCVIWTADSFPYVPEYPIYMHFIVAEAIPDSTMWEETETIFDDESVLVSVDESVFFRYWDRTGISEKTLLMKSIGINIAPNPFNSICYVGFSGKILKQYLIPVKIFNLVGQCVAEFEISGSNRMITWDASQMNAGIYLLRAEFDEVIIEKKMLLIK